MFFSEDFKVRVKAAYPDLEILHYKLDNNEDSTLSVLQGVNCLPSVLDLYPGALSIHTVIEAKSLDQLKTRSKKEKELIELSGITFSADRNKEFERRIRLLHQFYSDKEKARKALFAPAAFTASVIMNATSLKALHKEALLRRSRIELLNECIALYSAQNS